MEHDSADAETLAACEAVSTASFTVRCHPKKLARIKSRARKLGMSANDFFRHGAELALELTDKEFVRFAAACAAEQRANTLPEARP
jgi:hypothetical protein